jgi:hypothetical protein
MFNSIGYTNMEDDLKLFKDILGLTCTDGIIVIQTENRDWRLRNFFPYVNYDYGNIQLYESWNFNLERSTAESNSRYYERDPEDNSLRLVLELPTYMRIYSLHEIITILKNTRWVFQKSYGSIQTFAPVSLESSDIITIGKKGL